MNEIFFNLDSRKWFHKSALKRAIWKAAAPLALSGLCGMRFEDHWLRVERRSMPLRGLAPSWTGATIAHISDLHCSPMVVEKYLRQCVEALNDLASDFVVITGDFINGRRRQAIQVAHVLRELQPRVAVMACLGNHDYGIFHPRGRGGNSSLADFLSEELARADVFVMLNDCRTFTRDGGSIQFVGVEDFWSHRYNPYQAFEAARPAVPTIALSHNPDAAYDIARCGAQWILSGHTHGSSALGGKLSPLVMPSRHKHFVAGEYAVSTHSRLYVNRGLSYGRRTNLNSRPEITLFTLRPA